MESYVIIFYLSAFSILHVGAEGSQPDLIKLLPDGVALLKAYNEKNNIEVVIKVIDILVKTDTSKNPNKIKLLTNIKKQLTKAKRYYVFENDKFVKIRNLKNETKQNGGRGKRTQINLNRLDLVIHTMGLIRDYGQKLDPGTTMMEVNESQNDKEEESNDDGAANNPFLNIVNSFTNTAKALANKVGSANGSSTIENTNDDTDSTEQDSNDDDDDEDEDDSTEEIIQTTSSSTTKRPTKIKKASPHPSKNTTVSKINNNKNNVSTKSNHINNKCKNKGN